MRSAPLIRALALVSLLTGSFALAQPEKKAGDLPPGVVQMSDEQQKTIKLQLARAERQAISEPVRVPGTVAFDPGHVALIRPFEQARVVRLLVQPGDVVQAGQKLAELDMPGLATTQQDLIAMRASVREADAGVSVARDALRRAEILARDGSLSRAEAERRRLVLAQAVAAAETARARVNALQSQVARLNPGGSPGFASLVSPLSGIVTAVSATPGEVLAAARDAVTVADLGVVMVLAQVPEAAAAQVAIDDPAVVSTTTGNRRWEGTVATLGAALDPQARTLPARIRIGNPDMALRVGMLVDVTITDDTGRNAVVVPSAAVQLVADKHVVFTPLGDGRFQSHDVTLGVQRQDSVELRSGVADGAEVVTRGSFELKALLQKSMLGGG